MSDTLVSPQMFVVDADGNNMRRKMRSVKSKVSARKAAPVEASACQLDDLEEAIFRHGMPYRTKFLDLLQGQEVVNYMDMRPSAVLHCWNVLGWRPDSNNKNRVWVKNEANVYTKDK